MLRNLAFRENDRISVSLDWESNSDRVSVCVEDLKGDNAFTIIVAHADAMQAFNHPFPYRDWLVRNDSSRVLRDRVLRAAI